MSEIFGFVGTIGSGKTTIAKLLSNMYTFPYISTGDFLREEVSRAGLNSNSRLEIQEFFEKNYSSNIEKLCQSLFAHITSDTFVLDSFRGKNSYFALKNYFPNAKVHIIFCDVDNETSKRRQAQRGDGRVYSNDEKLKLIDFNDLDFFRENAAIILDTTLELAQSEQALNTWSEKRGV